MFNEKWQIVVVKSQRNQNQEFEFRGVQKRLILAGLEKCFDRKLDVDTAKNGPPKVWTLSYLPPAPSLPHLLVRYIVSEAYVWVA